MKLTGAQIVIECLVEQGVNTVFGYPGGAILNIYDELYKNSDRIRHILTAHEQGASHAADGYARSTGKVGVVMATSGPGATNLVTGIATAYMDSVPMIAITCNVGTSLLGKDSFQEIDITGVTMPITKHNFIVTDVNNLAETIREAFIIAKSGRPGPVLIDIPKDVTANQAEFVPLAEVKDSVEQAAQSANLKRILKVSTPSDDDVKKAAEIINSSVRPVIYAGGGVVISEAYDELKALAEKANIPVTVSLMGKTAFPAEHKLCTGMVGMHGTKASNMSVNESDLIIAIGARFSDRVISDAKKFAKNSKVFHIDIDPAEINKNIPTVGSLIGNVKDVLARLLPLINEKPESDWNKKVTEWKGHVPSSYANIIPMNPKVIFEHVHNTLGDDTIITTEVGQHQMWAAQFFKYQRPRQLLTSGGLGTMGYGLGAAIGAKVARPDKTVVNMAGDGCFRMNMNEIATATRYNIPIIEIVFNNHVLGMVRQWQDIFYGKRYSNTILEDKVDFVKVAESMGAKGYRVTTQEEFNVAFLEALNLGRPVVLDCIINPNDKVFPMVAPGAAISDIITE